MLYSFGEESDKKALNEIYVPMMWKKVEDPDSAEKDRSINSPMELFEQVIELLTMIMLCE